MKIKFLPMLIVVLGLAWSPSAKAELIENHPGAFKRLLISEGRGILNVVSVLAEPVVIIMNEPEKHPKAWPLTSLHRLAHNIGVRLTSGVYDVFFRPFSVAFTEDNRPITEHMGLPDYGWQAPMDSLT